MDKLSRRDKYLMKKYGILEADYLATLKEQKNRCAICKEKRKTLCQDHLHKKDLKGKQIKGDRSLNRGLLCFLCNKKLVGMLERMYKKPRVVAAGLVSYLTKYPTRED
jgi:hypothetical protein